jgi:hypothetical protein
MFSWIAIEKLVAIIHGLRAYGWMRVNAVVTSAGYHHRSMQRVQWHFGYTYEIGQTKLYGSKFRNGHPQLLPPRIASVLDAGHPKGSQLWVYVNPRSTRESVAVPGVGAHVWGGFLLSTIASAMVFAFTAYLLAIR